MTTLMTIKHLKCGKHDIDGAELNGELKFFCKTCRVIFKPHTDKMAYQKVELTKGRVVVEGAKE